MPALPSASPSTSRWSCGTRRSSNASSPLFMKRQPMVSLQRAMVRPFVSRGTRKLDVPCIIPTFGLVFAYTTNRPASYPLLMNCLRPLITQWPPSATALVCGAASGTLYGSQRSEAPRGSVRQCASRNDGSFTKRGNQRSCRCFGANLRSSTETFQFCTSLSARPESPRAISSAMMAKLRTSAAASSWMPPYSSGTASVRMPMRSACSRISAGRRASGSISHSRCQFLRMKGVTKSSTKARQLSRIIFCSSESPRSSMSAMAPILKEPGSFFALGCCMPSLPVLINPRSGGGFGDRDAKRLGEQFRSAGAEPSIRLARSHEELVAAAKQLVGERAPLVVAGGGDGTMNAVASVLAGSDTALGVLPLGTLNHFARDLRIPLALDAAVEIIVQGRRRSIDVGEVNGRVFVNNSSLGLYPAMVHRREKLRRRLGGGKWRAMLRAMLIVLRSHPFLEVALELDGVTHRRRTPFVFVGNNVYKMEGFTIGLREDLDRGVLSVYVTHRRRRLGLVLLALRALFGLLHQARDFEASTTRELRIESRHRRLLVATDGEVAALETPLDYRIRPGALQVIAP